MENDFKKFVGTLCMELGRMSCVISMLLSGTHVIA